ncbi:MAG: Tad domain-containing protein [Planctomycetota bacterium]
MVSMQARSTSRRSPCSLRRGIATIWVILSLPTALVLLITVVEIGNLWTARTELQTNLESAALAGVKTWGDLSEAASLPMDPHPTPGAIAITGAARDAAQAAFAVNSVNGQFFTLNDNETDDSNDDTGYDNTSCSGDIILGGFPTSAGSAFNATSAVGCGRSTMTTTNIAVDFDILVDATDTLTTANAFQISFTTSVPALYITELVIDLRNAPTAPLIQDDGVWDFGTVGTFSGAPTEATGNGPAIHASSDVTAGELLSATGDGTGTLTLTFSNFAWQAGETLIFGVDTDFVETGGVVGGTEADEGGDFGESGGAAVGDGRIAFSFGFGGPSTGNTLAQKLQSEMGGRVAELQGAGANFSSTVTIIVPDEDFAVLCQKTIQVNSIVDTIFGTSLGTFPVSGRAIATARCAGANSEVVENPLVVHVTGVSCP